MINLNVALRKKNRLVQEINKISTIIQTNNSLLVGNKTDYDIQKLLSDRAELVSKLIRFKLDIQKATVPIMDKILLVAEKKAEIAFLQAINTKDGLTEHNDWRSDSLHEYTANLKNKDIADKVSACEQEIDLMQSQIDKFNSENLIEDI